MLTEETFLRKIPAALAIEQRLLFEAISFAIDGILWSFARLKETAGGLAGAKDLKFDRVSERGLFAHGWSIVDQCHILRTLLLQLPLKPAGITEAFVSAYEQATLMRNAMDHLPQQLSNIAKSKKQKPPVFGVMCFCVIDENDIRENSDGSKTLTGCTSVAVTAGSLTHSNHQWELQNPTGKSIEFPVGAFQLEAFEYKLKISEMIADLINVVESLDAKLQSTVETAIREAALAAGLDGEKMIAEHAGGFRIAAKISFVDLPPT